MREQILVFLDSVLLLYWLYALIGFAHGAYRGLQQYKTDVLTNPALNKWRYIVKYTLRKPLLFVIVGMILALLSVAAVNTFFVFFEPSNWADSVLNAQDATGFILEAQFCGLFATGMLIFTSILFCFSAGWRPMVRFGVVLIALTFIYLSINYLLVKSFF